MNREAYKLANEIKTELGAPEDYLAECPKIGRASCRERV